MCCQYIYVVFAIYMIPVQLLLEGIILIAVSHSLGTSVVSFTVTDSGIVVRGLLGVSHVEVAFHCECEVVQELDICKSDSLQCVAYGFVRTQFVFPDYMTVYILVTGRDRYSLVIFIVSRIVLFVVQGIQAIRTIGIMQMHGIDGGYLSTIHKCIGISSVTVPIGCMRILVRAG